MANHYDQVFARSFHPEQSGQSNCKCLDSNGDVKVSFPGQCGDEADAKNKCWEVFKVLSTDSLQKQWEKKTLKVTHHFDLMHATKFEYAPDCEENVWENGCEDTEEGCFQSVLPSLSAGRSTEVKAFLGDILHAIAEGKMEEKDISDKAVMAMLGGLSSTDKAAVEFASYFPEQEAPDQLTVRVLKAAYEAKLAGTGISVDHLLQVASLDPVNGLDVVVTEEAYDRFLKPACD